MDSAKSKDDACMNRKIKSFDEIKGRRLFAINYDLSANAHLFNVPLGKNSLNFTAYYDTSFFSETESDSESEDMGFSQQFRIEGNRQPFKLKETSSTSDESFGDFPASPETHHLSDVQHMEEDSQTDIDAELSPNVSLPVDNAPVDQCFYCPYCLNRLDNKSFLIQTDVSNYVCPTCNMAFSRQLLLGQDIQTFESKEPIFTREESFSNFPDSTEEIHNLSDVQLLEEIYIQSENLQSDINVQSKDGLDNRARHVDQTDRINSIDFIEIDDDDDDDDDAKRIDVDANESLHYPHVLHCNSNDKDATPNVCIEETHFPDKDNERDPLIGDSPNDTLPTPGLSTSLEQSNSISKRGRWVKLVSDFDDFAERPFACALCYQRYSEFNQLSVHVKNHLTGGVDLYTTLSKVHFIPAICQEAKNGSAQNETASLSFCI